MKKGFFKSVSERRIIENPNFKQILEKNPALSEKSCKLCSKLGNRVLQVTMGSHVKEIYWPYLGDGFYFCSTPMCEVAYFNNHRNLYIVKRELRTRLGLKEKNPPKPVCYCLQINEEHIAEEILRKKCCYSLEDIEYYTKAGTGKWCLTTNPSGKCCRESLSQIVDKYLPLAQTSALKQQMAAIRRSVATDQKIPTKLVTLKIGKMTCDGCATSVGAALENAGARNVKVSYKDAKAEMAITPEIQPDELTLAVEQAGYTGQILEIKRLD
ncbi:MAG: hypothetical protein ACE5KO_00800 [Candidatus Bathyarchaeia archaeon]